jgi:hypothetical protein
MADETGELSDSLQRMVDDFHFRNKCNNATYPPLIKYTPVPSLIDPVDLRSFQERNQYTE